MPSNLNPSELIFDDQKRIYHLNCSPDDIADTIFLVGDQFRVKTFDRYFDKLEFKTQEREFVTHTGLIGNKRLSIISTGISTANVEIVLNELDALVNIDFEKREVKKKHRSLTLIRVGTSGGLHEDVPLDSFVVSTHGIGMSNLLKFYPLENSMEEKELFNHFTQQTALDKDDIPCFITSAHPELLKQFNDIGKLGITATCPGFYAPQGRHLRVRPVVENIIDRLQHFHYKQHKICNFEMETSALYGLGQILGHKCLSISAILANRITGEFSKQPKQTVEKLVRCVIERFSEL